MASSSLEDDALLLLNAASTARKAASMAPSSSAAQQNFAILLELLGARRQALDYWRRSLSLETDPLWSAEIADVLSDSPQPTEIELWERASSGDLRRTQSSWTSNQLLFSKVESAGLPAIRDSLAAHVQFPEWLWETAQILCDSAHDRFLIDVLSQLEGLGPTKHDAAARGISELLDGKDLLTSFRANKALPKLQNAKRLLNQANSPLGIWALQLTANAHYYNGERYEALSDAREAFDLALRNQYSNISSHAGRMLGNILLETGKPEESLEALKKSEFGFRSTAQKGHLSSTLSQIATSYKSLGDYTAEWRYRLDALRLASEFGDKKRLPVLFGLAALSASELGEYEAALAFHDETFVFEVASNEPLNIAEALWWRGVIHDRGNQRSLALADTEDALRYAKLIQNETNRRNTLIGISKLHGELLITSDPAAALLAFQEALDLGDSLELEYIAGELHLLRSRAARNSGDLFLAEQELLMALGEFEEKRGRIQDRNKRASYFEKARPVFEDLVLNQRALGRDDEALAYADFGRARELQSVLDRDFRSPGSVDPSPGDIPRWLRRRPAGAPPIVFYEVLDSTTIVWVCNSGQVQSFDLGMGRKAIASLVNATVDQLARARRTPDSGAAFEAFHVLVGPWLTQAASASRIVIVPDEDLFRLPFHALMDRASGEYLIEKTEIVLSPNLDWADGRPLTTRSAATPTLLAAEAVAGPEGVDAPPRADEEVDELSRLYSGFKRLRPETSEQFAREAGKYDFVHFAGHATAGNRRSEPHLIFGPDDLLTVSEIRDLDLRRNRLVVLAACETNAAKKVGLDGPASLASAFLSAGAHGVLATLRDVKDGESFLLMKRFHAHLARGEEPPTAFRSAIVEMIHEEKRGPFAWSPFELIGSFSSPRQ